MPDLQRRLNFLHRLALICCVLVLAIVVISAFIRLADGGPGCTPWPQCYGQQRTGAAESQTQASPGIALARPAHRVLASLALLVVIALVVSCFARRPFLWREGRLALALLVLALALAVLGIYSGGARIPAIGVGNLVGGLVMFALCVRLCSRRRPTLSGDTAAAGSLGVWAGVAGLVLLTQVVLGGLVSTSHAGASCAGWLDCSAALGAATQPWQALNPWVEVRFDPQALPTHRSAAPLLWLHHVLAALLAVVVLWVAVLAWRAGRARLAAAMVLLLVMQMVLGLTMVGGMLGSSLGLGLALAHNLLAALFLALLFRLPRGSAQPRG